MIEGDRGRVKQSLYEGTERCPESLEGYLTVPER